MGGCLSKKRYSRTTKKPDPTTAHGITGSDAAPPPFPEEETVVKEVLSETPKPSTVTKSSSNRIGEEVKIEKGEVVAGGGDRSEEASEICSVSESFSVSTTTTKKRGGEEQEVGEMEEGKESTTTTAKWRGERSPAGKNYQRKRSLSGEFSVSRDPRGSGGRSSPSPVKRLDGRSFPRREEGQTTSVRVHAGCGNAAVRRDYGERSRTRPVVSPATKLTADRRLTCGGGGGVSRSSNLRKTERASPRRIIPSAAKEKEEAEETRERDGAVASLKESLENPLVSLECFIFL